MNLSSAEVKMLKQLMNIAYEDQIDLFIDDIKTFGSLLHRVNAKNPLKNDLTRDVVKLSREKELKTQARKYWNRRNRHKNKQKLKGAS